MNEKVIVSLRLATKPGVPNVNGIIYSQEEYDKMLKQAQLCINDRSLKLADPSYNPITHELDKIYGDVISIKPGEIEVEVKDINKLDILKEAIDDDYVAGMKYIADVNKNADGVEEATNLKILSYSLIKI